MTGDGPVVLESEALRVTVNPLVGGTITAIEHKGLGASVLGTTPWEPEVTTPDSFAAPDERIWLTRYGGGWPLLFPNGGDACEFDGVFHGFHGEASLAPWEAEGEGAVLRLRRRFASVPVDMHREMTVTGELVTVRERLRMLGTQPVKVMWGHHPTFGSDLLAGPFEIQSGARHVTVDDGYDPAAESPAGRAPSGPGLWSRERPAPSISAGPRGVSPPWSICRISPAPGCRSAASTIPSPRPCHGSPPSFPMPGSGTSSAAMRSRPGRARRG